MQDEDEVRVCRVRMGGHVDEWALDDFSAHLNGTFVCSSTAYFHARRG